MGLTMNKLIRLCLLSVFLVLTTSAQAQIIAPAAGLIESANPHYYYDRETAFVLNYVIDDQFGGVLLAVDEVGTPYGQIDTVVWGVPPERPLFGTDKSLVGQATCIRYFIAEYQRISGSGVGVAGINALLEPGTPRLTSAASLLSYARTCADFVNDNLIIDDAPPGDFVIPDVYDNTTWNGNRPNRNDALIPNMLYYWSMTSRNADNRFIDDTDPRYGVSAERSESGVAWSIAELALLMRDAGVGGWQTYRDAALGWWNWQLTADDPPPYNGQNINNISTARDIFRPALGMTLTRLTGDASYRTAAEAQLNAALGTGSSPSGLGASIFSLADNTYIAGFGRGVAFSQHDQTFAAPLADRDQWWDFGNFPIFQGGTVYLDPGSQPAFNAGNLNIPFAHFAGRELMAGVLRSYWFFHTYGPNTQMPYATGMADVEAVSQAVADHWFLLNETLWDDATGYASWIESTSGEVYKPCFSAGTDIPIADWLAPVIGDKVHTLNPDNSALVEVSGVRDEDFAYMSWSFRGSGVAADVGVEVVYSFDNGATWETLTAVRDPASGSFFATIPPSDPGIRVFYYATARDRFNNRTAFPEGSEIWDNTGQTISRNTAVAQFYGPEGEPGVPGEPGVSAEPGVVSFASGGDFDIVKLANPPFALPGQDITWTISVSNNSDAAAPVSFVDQVPDSLIVLSANASVGNVSISGNSVSFSLDSLAPGSRVTVTIATRVRDSMRPPYVIENRVGDAVARVLSITTLPATGETPVWRQPLIVALTVGSLISIFYFIRR